MKMGHRLAGPFVAIDDEPIAFQSFLFGDLGSRQMKMTEQSFIFRFHVRMCPDDFARNDQDMGRRLRIDVSKRHALFVLVNNVGGEFPLCDFEKDVSVHHWHGCVPFVLSCSLFDLIRAFTRFLRSIPLDINSL